MSEADFASDLLEAEQALSERQGGRSRWSPSATIWRTRSRCPRSRSNCGRATVGVTGADSQSGSVRWVLVASAGGLVLVLAALLPWVIVIGVPGWFIARRLIRRNRKRKLGRNERPSQGQGRRATGRGTSSLTPAPTMRWRRNRTRPPGGRSLRA